MGLQMAWYVLAVVGAYRMTAVGFDAVVRRIVRLASQATAEHSAIPTPRVTVQSGRSVPPGPGRDSSTGLRNERGEW